MAKTPKRPKRPNYRVTFEIESDMSIDALKAWMRVLIIGGVAKSTVTGPFAGHGVGEVEESTLHVIETPAPPPQPHYTCPECNHPVAAHSRSGCIVELAPNDPNGLPPTAHKCVFCKCLLHHGRSYHDQDITRAHSYDHAALEQ